MPSLILEKTKEKNERWAKAKRCRREVYFKYGRGREVFAGRCGACGALIVTDRLETRIYTKGGDAPKTPEGLYLDVYPHIVVARCPYCGKRNVMLTGFPNQDAAFAFFQCLEEDEDG